MRGRVSGLDHLIQSKSAQEMNRAWMDLCEFCEAKPSIFPPCLRTRFRGISGRRRAVTVRYLVPEWLLKHEELRRSCIVSGP